MSRSSPSRASRGGGAVAQYLAATSGRVTRDHGTRQLVNDVRNVWVTPAFTGEAAGAKTTKRPAQQRGVGLEVLLSGRGVDRSFLGWGFASRSLGGGGTRNGRVTGGIGSGGAGLSVTHRRNLLRGDGAGN